MGDVELNIYRNAPEHLPYSLRHEVTVTAVSGGDGYPLDMEDVEVTLSEDWAPYAQVKVTIAAPEDQSLLDDVLDPRRDCRLVVQAGYTYPNNTRQMGLLADVGLRARPLRRPADTVELDGGSGEYRAQDYRALWWADMERSGITEAVSWLAGYAEGWARGQKVQSDFPAGYGAKSLEGIEVTLGTDYWSLMADAAARTDTRVFCNEYGIWQVTRRVDKAGTPIHRLAVGEGGTITDSTADLNRDAWYNAVLLEYRWTDAQRVEHVVHGRALAQGAKYGVDAVGHKTHYERIERPVTEYAAGVAARAKLRTLLSRGRSRTITAAAAYWLRPGDTVEVQLPTGDPELHIVQSIRFNPLVGLMTVTTRQPLDVEITNGE